MCMDLGHIEDASLLLHHYGWLVGVEDDGVEGRRAGGAGHFALQLS